MARVPYRDPDDLPAEYRDLLYSSRDPDETANVFRALANDPPVLDSFRKYFGVLWAESGLDERERELVILTAARAADSTYEWHQHVRIARSVGVDDDEIRAIGSGDFATFAGREATLLRFARAVAEDAVDDARFASAAAEFDDSTLVGVAMLASGYLGLARALSALDVDVEADQEFVGWDLAGT